MAQPKPVLLNILILHRMVVVSKLSSRSGPWPELTPELCLGLVGEIISWGKSHLTAAKIMLHAVLTWENQILLISDWVSDNTGSFWPWSPCGGAPFLLSTLHHRTCPAFYSLQLLASVPSSCLSPQFCLLPGAIITSIMCDKNYIKISK